MQFSSAAIAVSVQLAAWFVGSARFAFDALCLLLELLLLDLLAPQALFFLPPRCLFLRLDAGCKAAGLAWAGHPGLQAGSAQACQLSEQMYWQGSLLARSS
jgi:hypothetical protein